MTPVSPTMGLRWKCEEILRVELEIAWEAYREVTRSALSALPLRLPTEENVIFALPEWRLAAVLRERYMKCLKRYSKLVLAKTVPDMIEWATVMGWEVQTEDGVIVRIQEMIEKKQPGRAVGQAKERQA